MLISNTTPKLIFNINIDETPPPLFIIKPHHRPASTTLYSRKHKTQNYSTSISQKTSVKHKITQHLITIYSSYTIKKSITQTIFTQPQHLSLLCKIQPSSQPSPPPQPQNLVNIWNSKLCQTIIEMHFLKLHVSFRPFQNPSPGHIP